MARSWLSVTVELLGGRGEEFWPWPGRIFAVGPSHTFADLAHAINGAFARWDLSHLSMFTLADGTLVADSETVGELTESPFGPITLGLDMDSAKVAKTLQPGAEFRFVFDLGDDWTHRCVIEEEKVDPVEVLGIRPSAPLSYWGWGAMPDQYGRRWADDDGQGRTPRRPNAPHPMLDGAWPQQNQAEPVDIAEVRAAVEAEDVGRYLAAITGREIDNDLHEVAAGIRMVLAQQRGSMEAVALSIVNRLTFRRGPGDEELAETLLAQLRH
ncbi:plasmid pRiA4b ORF-3 family protein [Ruania zhangjianzhongii]|uniref:plasmid pRiA4b ORF-3 family protein n=1 Tax=Ruania zhangjianzhongii TaxID=2603206 RepID=UPI0011C946FC|nr:plasmid pRiA4b ORF-3 family protein [Ruania zhangjianzhongii]